MKRNAKLLERVKEYQNSFHQATENLAERGKSILALQTRVAELEADATLGRLVREMPRNARLGHEGQQWGEWYAVWPGDNVHYSRQYGPTPEAALEAARKGETWVI